ncbi:MAG: hypothetical protein PUB67_05265 [Clostridiales bacterium]|nr:hypothetical protein [Clostridiales bacterium]
MNPKDLMKFMQAKNTFNTNHPRVEPFIKAVVADGIREGSVIEVKVISPEGEAKVCNIRVRESDIELLRLLGGNKE